MIHYQDEEITRAIIAAAIEVHKTLGPGLLESTYKTCLLIELEENGLQYREEVAVPIIYKNRQIDGGFRIDVLVADRVVVELKSVEHILPVHEAQVLTYLRLLEKQVGLLINFHVPVLKRGIRRCVLNAREKVILNAAAKL
jgi:GxxExxY protein